MANKNIFLTNVLFTDKTNLLFTILIFGPTEITTNRSHFQQQFALSNHFLLVRLTCEAYTDFSRDHLLILLELVMHDGVPGHFNVLARQHLDVTNPNRWIR